MLTRTVITDANGAPRGVVVASLDTTERYAMEEKLAGEQRRAALIVRAANVGILDWDGVNRTVYYSPRFREILRYPPDADTSGWPDYFDLVHPEDRERVQKQFREHIRGSGPHGASELHELIQYRLRRADGTYVWVEAFGASVRDAQGFATPLHRLDQRHQRAPLPGGGAALGGAPARGGRAHVAPRPEDADQQRDRHVAPAARGRRASAARTTSCSAASSAPATAC